MECRWGMDRGEMNGILGWRGLEILYGFGLLDPRVGVLPLTPIAVPWNTLIQFFKFLCRKPGIPS
jgi:hypothetical protein